MFSQRLAVLSLVAVLSMVLGTNSATAACSDRPGTPNEVRAEPISATAIRLHWKNTSNKAGGSHDMWFDISVKDGRNQGVGKDITGGAEQRGVRYGQFSSHDFTGLQPDTEYRFQIHARTEGGTQGCISAQPSGVATTRTPTTQVDGTCNTYANTALRQLATAKAMPSSASCPVDGPRWSGDRQAHYDWCVSIRGSAATANEQKAREDQLNVCRGRNTADPRAPAPKTFGTLRVRGIELVSDAVPPATGTMPIVAEKTFLAGANLCSIAKAPPNLPDFDTMLKSMVPLANSKFLAKSPFKLRSDVSGSLSSSCEARAEMATVSSGEIVLIITMPQNQVTAAFTTPDAKVPVAGKVGAPRDADPRARVTFDVEARTTVRLPANTASQIGLGQTTIHVSKVHVEPLNIPADIAKIANDVTAFFTGTDFLARLTQDRIIRFGALSTSLNDINSNFRKIPPKFRLAHEYNSSTETVVLHATGRPEDKGPVVR
jgi:Fibronectin type III domain